MTRRNPPLRRGLTTLMAVLVITMLFVTAALAYSIFATRDSYIDLRIASHAGSLAAVGTLAHDDLLTNNRTRVLSRIAKARSSAVQVAEANQLNGLFVSMAPLDLTNDPAGNLVFGNLDREINGTFTPFFPLATAPFPGGDSAYLNAVRIDVAHPRRPGVRVRMYAHSDHDIVGFKPTNARNAPVVPIALFTDIVHVIPSANSLEAALAAPTVDTAQFNYTTGVFEALPVPPPADGIGEIKFEYGLPSGDPTAISTRLLAIGASNWFDADSQVADGISLDDLSDDPFTDKQFVLSGPSPSLNVPEITIPPSTPAQFAGAFDPIIAPKPAIPRVFPLYSGLDPITDEPIIVGFIAARVVSVVYDDDRATVTIQPTMISTPLAVTNPVATVPPDTVPFNPYIGKLRIAANVTETP